MHIFFDIFRPYSDRGRFFLKVTSQRCTILYQCMDYGQVNYYYFCSYVPFLTKPRCDEVTLDNKTQPSNVIHDSYAQVQKMHAAMTKNFSSEYGLGSLEWHWTRDGAVGNPSISPEVANYMSGLHRWKVSLLPHLGYIYFICIRLKPAVKQPVCTLSHQ